jgi:hypothetical protein
MESDRFLLDYLPPELAKLREMKAIMSGEDPEFDLVWSAVDQTVDNCFIQTADDEALARLERIAGIAPDAEPREFRVVRYLTKINNRIPYTWRWFLRRLDTLYGLNNLMLTLDTDSYSLSIKIKLGVKHLKDLVADLAEQTVPQNLLLSVEFLYNLWGTYTAKSKTWGDMRGRTWRQMKEDEVI